MEELSRSILASGIIQPLLLRPVGNRYELIAGERRWRAAQLAGLTKVPAIVREVADELALEMTLIENIQREDLNPIEAARAFDRLITDFQMTPEMVAERTGKDRTTVSNAIRLLKLESTIQEWIEEGKLTGGSWPGTSGSAGFAAKNALCAQGFAWGLNRKADRAVGGPPGTQSSSGSQGRIGREYAFGYR